MGCGLAVSSPAWFFLPDLAGKKIQWLSAISQSLFQKGADLLAGRAARQAPSEPRRFGRQAGGAVCACRHGETHLL